MTKVWWKSKTFWFGALVAIVPFLVEMRHLVEQVGGPEIVGMALGVVIVILRMVTKEPVGLADKKDYTKKLRF